LLDGRPARKLKSRGGLLRDGALHGRCAAMGINPMHKRYALGALIVVMIILILAFVRF
jgi:hypothetical protein